MKKVSFAALTIAALAISTPHQIHAQVALIAKGTLTGSSAGANADLSGLKKKLENGVPANLLGGLGSGIAYVSGDEFLALPDRGPNAVSFDSAVDDTVSYINRFHTVRMHLRATPGGTLPFTISPQLTSTTLLSSVTPLVYGSGEGLGVGPGAPAQNRFLVHYFTGRSDNFDPDRTSGNAADARLDPESIRVSNDGLSVFISDEYGPYVYEFARFGGFRVGSLRTAVELICRVQHQHRVVEAKPAPAEVVRGTGRGTIDDFKAQQITVEMDRRRHVENLEERAKPFHLQRHGFDPRFVDGNPACSVEQRTPGHDSHAVDCKTSSCDVHPLPIQGAIVS
jgi:hypothetical protein